jgi:hypothetical protein
MNAKLKPTLKCLFIFSSIVLCLTATSPVQRAQQSAPTTTTQPAPTITQSTPATTAATTDPATVSAQVAAEKLVVSYPPGAVAAFPEPLEQSPGTFRPSVYASPVGAQFPSERVWLLNARLIEAKPAGTEEPREPGGTTAESAAATTATTARAPKSLVAFLVPQLPRGAYDVRYLDAGGTKTTTIFIEPQLQAAHGLVAGNPGDELEVSFGIETSYVANKMEGAVQTRVPVTLKVGDASVVELAPEQQASKTTGEDGFATWKIRFKAVGETMLTATAPDFEQAESRVVSTSRPAAPEARKVEGEADKAADAADTQTEKSRAAQADVEKAVAKILLLRESFATGAASSGTKGLGGYSENHLYQMNERRALAEREMITADSKEARWLGELSAARAKLAAMTPATPTAVDVPRLLDGTELLPGDVILMRGVKFYSTAILGAEVLNFGSGANYSHSALYVGDGLVAEMLGNGYNLHPWPVSIDKATNVDVYRWRNLTGAQRALIAKKARSYGGTLYAEPQIFLLGLAAASVPPMGGLALAALGVDYRSGGERQMICSELVARSYHHAGLEMSVAQSWKLKFWASLGEVLTSDDRLHDYTTPNALAVSGILTKEGRLR